MGTRVDRYLAEATGLFASRKAAWKACKRGEVLLNGVPVVSSRLLDPGDTLSVVAAERTPPAPWEARLSLPWVDPWLAVAVKPPGLAVHGPRRQTLINALAAALPPSSAPDALPWAHPVHRLDARTGGLIVVARASAAQVALGRLFQTRAVYKRYRALVLGLLEGEGSIDTPIDGRAAHSDWRAVAHHRALRSDWVTTVDVWPRTGRKHQIRAHLAALGHPVLGDARYHPDGNALQGKGLFLWSVEVGLDHPITGSPLRVGLEDPARLLTWRDREAARWGRRADRSSTNPRRGRTSP